VAAGSTNGRRFERWRCTGVGKGFGHCHGRGIRRGGIVHWAVNHLPRGLPRVSITLDRYGHLKPGNEAEAAEMLDVYLQRASK